MAMTTKVQSEKTLIEKPSDLISTQSPPDLELHTLCPNCQTFVQKLTDTQWLSDTLHHLCDVAQLRESQRVCHLCILILSKLKQEKISLDASRAHWKVYLRPNERGGKPHEMGVILSNGADGEANKGTRSMPFKMGAYSLDSDHGNFSQHISASHVPMQARDNLKRAGQWIRACATNHADCSAFRHKTTQNQCERPTRVLEVTPKSIRLRCNMSKEDFEYLVLSHMWGAEPERQLRLQLETSSQFQQEVPIHLLSDVYKEAIRATLIMGYKYLWIDSLCIIQDSAADWEYEARRMALVYSNAACNLAYLFPPSTRSPNKDDVASQRILRSRNDPRAWNPCILVPALPGRPGLYVAHPTSTARQEGHSDDEKFPWLVQRDWPLFSRAWTFQEYLLAPRTLLLGHANLMWQCSEFFYDELLGPLMGSSGLEPNRGIVQFQCIGKRRYYPQSLAQIATLDGASAVVAWDFMWNWIKSANEYRGRALSHPKDRIIAFAGIARAVAQMGQLTYIAGLWDQILPACLLWTMTKRIGVKIIVEGSEEFLKDAEYSPDVREEVVRHAPSWSWFSVPIYNHYELGSLLDERQIFVRTKGANLEDARMGFYHDDLWWLTSHGREIDWGNGPYPHHESYDNFEKLKLTLTAPILPVRQFKPTDIDNKIKELRSTNLLDSEIEWTPDFIYYPDDPVKIGRGAPKSALLVLIATIQVTTLRAANVYQYYMGMVVSRADQEGVWKRIGVFKLTIHIGGAQVDKDDPRSVANRWREYGSLLSYWDRQKVFLL